MARKNFEFRLYPTAHPLMYSIRSTNCLTIGRDHAAALVILGRGLRLHAQTKPEVKVSVA